MKRKEMVIFAPFYWIFLLNSFAYTVYNRHKASIFGIGACDHSLIQSAEFVMRKNTKFLRKDNRKLKSV